ncbi:beta-ketoacyl-[acyl-carrier-protein] synthase family protein [Chitinophaga nivalis]|uniref:3-oxoacyl-[acyl-carrier-protein] synthase 1 n=1 Tax=Chitinophaga nivalis TaxID=2991709 RepID=A0ABT3IHX5_9BACT|nr:beta-ketoacyl-[acyl-carrier-protein] synthase family protein [Chitinophaga nivalis]MCW3466746.1 beta-ketoacyl-[acyl-carrier-protein] synthase family protein [Chitinophaga nivalis]MCW3483563.1 beta-ketoacyl-[acyl-carrier-protein] synthase family protein [Chitinophaga nivalis]
MHNRVVITGLGVVAPNGTGVPAFRQAIQQGESGIRYDPRLEALQFSCCVAGEPVIPETLLQQYFDPLELRGLQCSSIVYGVIAGMEAWLHAGLPLTDTADPDWESGVIFGAGSSGVDKIRDSIYKVDALQIRKLGSTVVVQTMTSGVSAFLGGKLGLGNQVSTNSAACTTGVESILMAYDRIRYGHATRMLAGSTGESGPYIWGGFDAMKVTTWKGNSQPAAASRPMSASAAGIVPGSGAGALVLESLESALARGATIYGEILGGHLNGGGQRNGGSMTAPNSMAVQRCITTALNNAGVTPQEVDVINGHLTATGKDAAEIHNWCVALNRYGQDFPYLNALKGMTGHCLSGSGAIELVSAVLQLHEGFLFPNINCEDLHPEIADLVAREKIPQQWRQQNINILIKASFGFGDVNGCVVLKKYA